MINSPQRSVFARRAAEEFSAGRLDSALQFLLREVFCGHFEHEVLKNTGVVLANLKDWRRACQFFEWAVRLDPRDSAGLLDLGKARFQQGDLLAAIRALEASVALDPASKMSHVHLSQAKCQGDLFDSAVSIAHRAFQIDPADPYVLCEVGYALRATGFFESSLEMFGRSVVLAPDQPGTLHTMASCELHLGDFSRGFRLYEFRWRSPEFLRYHREHELQRWSGQPAIRGRKLLLFSEQGFGDTIMFLRFAGKLTPFGAEVTLLVPPELERLCTDVPGVFRVTSRIPQELHHASCPLMSLPAIMGTCLDTVPYSDGAYLHARPEWVLPWRERLGHLTGPLIGLCWSTSENPLSRNRGVPLGSVSALYSTGLNMISLQKMVSAVDAEFLAWSEAPILHFGNELTDFAATAGLIELIDLVVTVDTAVAHLAGAMGKEVWILLPKRADWRWLVDRTDSPWYPRARLFRQTVEGDWRGPLEAVNAALIERFGLKARA